MSQHTLKVIGILILVPIGFGSKVYTGWGETWVRHHLGGFAYVVFWCWTASVFWPRVRPITIASLVFLGTSVVEVSQLWQPGFLNDFRSSTIGGALIGAEFDGWDFPHYVAGAVVGALGLRAIQPTGGDDDGIPQAGNDRD